MKNATNNQPLTKREIQVLNLLIVENTNQETADILHLSVNTVETHRRNIMRKLKIKTILGLYHWAVKNEVMTVDGESSKQAENANATIN
jgi:two-component system, NarL family, invasion response regulator UvrY